MKFMLEEGKIQHKVHYLLTFNFLLKVVSVYIQNVRVQ